jgi:hypothetical protein
MKTPLLLSRGVVVPVRSLRTCAYEAVFGSGTPHFPSGEAVSRLRDEVFGLGGPVVALRKRLLGKGEAVAAEEAAPASSAKEQMR